jgi:hypothetical protein
MRIDRQRAYVGRPTVLDGSSSTPPPAQRWVACRSRPLGQAPRWSRFAALSQISDMVKSSVELVDLGKPGVPGVLGIRRPSSLPVGGFSHVDGTPLCWAGEPIKRREFRF